VLGRPSDSRKNRAEYDIAGLVLMPPLDRVPDSPQFWAPLMMRDQVLGGRNHSPLQSERKVDSLAPTGRMKSGITPAQAQAEINVITEQLSRAYPDPQRKVSVSVTSGATFLSLSPPRDGG
jgi:hypothetical protein